MDSIEFNELSRSEFNNLLQQADDGDVEIQYALACYYLRGKLDSEPAKRKEEFEKLIYSSYRSELDYWITELDGKRAYHYLQMAASGGQTDAQCLLGLLNLFGISCASDFDNNTIILQNVLNGNSEDGIHYLECAANQDHLASVLFLQEYYLSKFGNCTEYHKYLEKGAALGDRDSLYAIGVYHLFQDASPQKGIELCEKYACIPLDHGIRKNKIATVFFCAGLIELAVEWFREAMREDNTGAAINYGYLLWTGINGVLNANPALAHKIWLDEVKHARYDEGHEDEREQYELLLSLVTQSALAFANMDAVSHWGAKLAEFGKLSVGPKFYGPQLIFQNEIPSPHILWMDPDIVTADYDIQFFRERRYGTNSII